MTRLRQTFLFVGITAAVIVGAGLTDLGQTVKAAIKAQIVRDADAPANYPYLGGISNTGFGVPVPLTTPDGQPVKRLVLEYVSGNCTTTNLSTIITSVELGVQVGNTNGYHNFIPTLTYSVENNQYGISQPTRIYADPGTSMYLGTGGTSGGNPSCSLVLSGYFVTQ